MDTGGSDAGLGLAESSDESLRALNCILEAWEDAADSGIRPQYLAYAAIYTALSDLVAEYGEENVAQLVNGLIPRVRSGEFTLARTQQ